MVRVIGPLFSLGASGTYRDELVFRQKNGGTIVSCRPQITAERSQAQIDHIQKVKDLSYSWGQLTQQDRDQWATCGALVAINGYRYYWQQWFLQGSTLASLPVQTCS